MRAMSSESSVGFFRWAEMPKERVTDRVSRRQVWLNQTDSSFHRT